ncbi:MAG: hypothetical protein ABWY25_07450 [Paenisporosarcina sp.]
MKRKFKKIVSGIKDRARKFARWMKSEDVTIAATAIGVVVSTSVLGYSLGVLVGQRRIINEARIVIDDITKAVEQRSKVVDIYVKLMDAFLTETPERWETFVNFRDAWKFKNNVVTS